MSLQTLEGISSSGKNNTSSLTTFSYRKTPDAPKDRPILVAKSTEQTTAVPSDDQPLKAEKVDISAGMAVIAQLEGGLEKEGSPKDATAATIIAFHGDKITDETALLSVGEYRRTVARLIQENPDIEPIALYSLFYQPDDPERIKAVKYLKEKGVLEKIEGNRAKYLMGEIFGHSFSDDMNLGLMRIIDDTRFKHFGWLWDTHLNSMQNSTYFIDKSSEIMKSEGLEDSLVWLSKLDIADLNKVFGYIGKPTHYSISWVITSAGTEAAYILESHIRANVLAHSSLCDRIKLEDLTFYRRDSVVDKLPFFVSSKTDFNRFKELNGQEMLDKLFISGRPVLDKETILSLAEAGANINAADQSGHTLLMRAAQKKDKEIVEALIGAGADTDLANNNGETALMVAARSGLTPAAFALLDLKNDSPTLQPLPAEPGINIRPILSHDAFNLAQAYQLLGFRDYDSNNIIDKRLINLWRGEGYRSEADIDNDGRIELDEIKYFLAANGNDIFELTDPEKTALTSKLDRRIDYLLSEHPDNFEEAIRKIAATAMELGLNEYALGISERRIGPAVKKDTTSLVFKRLAQTGNYDEYMQLSRKLNNEDRNNIYRTIIDHMLNSGKVDEAIGIITTGTDAYCPRELRDELSLKVFGFLADAGQNRTIFEILSNMTDYRVKERLYPVIAEMFINKGKIREAINMSAFVDNHETKQKLLEKIAVLASDSKALTDIANIIKKSALSLDDRNVLIQIYNSAVDNTGNSGKNIDTNTTNSLDSATLINSNLSKIVDFCKNDGNNDKWATGITDILSILHNVNNDPTLTISPQNRSVILARCYTWLGYLLKSIDSNSSRTDIVYKVCEVASIDEKDPIAKDKAVMQLFLMGVAEFDKIKEKDPSFSLEEAFLKFQCTDQLLYIRDKASTFGYASAVGYMELAENKSEKSEKDEKSNNIEDEYVRLADKALAINLKSMGISHEISAKNNEDKQTNSYYVYLNELPDQVDFNAIFDQSRSIYASILIDPNIGQKTKNDAAIGYANCIVQNFALCMLTGRYQEIPDLIETSFDINKNSHEIAVRVKYDPLNPGDLNPRETKHILDSSIDSFKIRLAIVKSAYMQSAEESHMGEGLSKYTDYKEVLGKIFDDINLPYDELVFKQNISNDEIASLLAGAPRALVSMLIEANSNRIMKVNASHLLDELIASCEDKITNSNISPTEKHQIINIYVDALATQINWKIACKEVDEALKIINAKFDVSGNTPLLRLPQQKEQIQAISDTSTIQKLKLAIIDSWISTMDEQIITERGSLCKQWFADILRNPYDSKTMLAAARHIIRFDILAGTRDRYWSPPSLYNYWLYF